MDKVTLQAELESAQAQLASSKTEYEYQTKNYARTKTLHEKQLVSDAEYDQAFYLYETARNAYEQIPFFHIFDYRFIRCGPAWRNPLVRISKCRSQEAPDRC